MSDELRNAFAEAVNTAYDINNLQDTPSAVFWGTVGETLLDNHGAEVGIFFSEFVAAWDS